MEEEKVLSSRSTLLRKNNSKELKIEISPEEYNDIFLINGVSFLTEDLTESDFIIKPNSCYMLINFKKNILNIHYTKNIANHEVIYNPYLFENSVKILLKERYFKKRFKIPDRYISTLPKWYSFKFSYPDYNLIFIRPKCGLSIQYHKDREEFWEVLEGNPIIINGNKVNYYVEKGTKFQNKFNTFHSIINPNKEEDEFVLIKERWGGKFNEYDIERVFNPNHYD
jgi:mannose-6-phosphate isomerase-like protein (cupin superfamily)